MYLPKHFEQPDRQALIALMRERPLATLVVATPDGPTADLIPLEFAPDAGPHGTLRGHVAYAVDDIYATCQRLVDHGVLISRPPRDGRMAFVRSPDNISIELLQAGTALPVAEPWKSMPNVGAW